MKIKIFRTGKELPREKMFNVRVEDWGRYSYITLYRQNKQE